MIDLNGSTKLLRQPFDKLFPCFSNSSIVCQIGLQTIALDKIGIIAFTVYMLFNGILAQQKNIGGPSYSVLTSVWYIQDLAYGRTTLYGYAAAVSYVLFICILFFTGNIYIFTRKKKEVL